MGYCAGVFGKWCVWAIFPVYSPPKIRYKYPGQEWGEVIGGETYTLEQVPELIAADYAPHAEATINYSGGSIPAYLPTAGNGANASFTGEYLYWDWLNPLSIISNSSTGYNAYSINIFFKDSGGTTRSVTLYPQGPPGWYESPWWWRPAVGRAINGLELRPSNPRVIRPKRCIFKVFNKNGEKLLELTDQVCPEVIAIPEKCDFKPENKRQVGEWFNLFPRYIVNPLILPYATIEERGNNCVEVYVNTPLNPLLRLQIANVCADCPDARPIVWIDCPCDDCRDKKCPEGTVWKILEGNTLLCLDAGGCVLSSIPFDPRCEQPNCSCG